MSHVDEGALHAYLDGALDSYPAGDAERIRAHLETCEECARRLDEEARVRDEAAGILAAAAPEFEMGPLEELRARARARVGRGLAGSRIYRMSWAASVVLALGTGWLLRGGQPLGTGPAGMADDLTGPVAPKTVEDALPAQFAEEAEADRPEPDQDAPLEDEVQPSAPANRSVAAPPPPAAPEAVDAAATAGAAPAAREVSVDAVAVPLASVGLVAEREAQPTGALAVDSPGPQTADSVPAAQRVAPPGPVQAADRAAVAARPVRAREEAARLRRESAVEFRARAAAEPSRDANEAARGRADTEPEGSLVVPGLELVSVSWIESGAPRGSVRVIQLLESGDTLELLHLPAGSNPAELAVGAADGRTELVVPRSDGWLIVRAMLEGEALRQLVARMGPGL